MYNQREEYAKNSLYLGHLFGGVTTVEAITYAGLRLRFGELSPQTSSFIHFSLLGFLSVTLISYSYYFGFKNGRQVHHPEINRLILESDEESSVKKNVPPNSPSSVNSDGYQYEIINKDQEHFKAY